MDTQRFPGRRGVGLQTYQTLSIASGSSLSASALVQGFQHFALYIPTITTASVTFHGALYSGDTFRAITTDAGTAMNMPATAGNVLVTSSSILNALRGLYAVKVKVSADGASAASFLLGCAG